MATYPQPMPDVAERLSGTLTEITEGIVGDADEGTLVRKLIAASTDVLAASDAGVMVVDPSGGLALLAASDERSRFVELLQVHGADGPCRDCVTALTVVSSDDLRDEERWPRFTSASLAVGFRAVHAVPLRLDGRAVGGLNLLHNEPTSPEPWRLRAAQAVADLTTVALSREPGARRGERLAERTIAALNDRVTVAQAVGYVAGSTSWSPDEARAALDRYGADHHRPLRDLAREILDGTLDPAVLQP